MIAELPVGGGAPAVYDCLHEINKVQEDIIEGMQAQGEEECIFYNIAPNTRYLGCVSEQTYHVVVEDMLGTLHYSTHPHLPMWSRAYVQYTVG